MRRLSIALLALAACGQEPTREEKAQAVISAPASGASASTDFTQLDRYSGQVVTVTGKFDHDRATNGIVILDSGLRITIPHFDQYMQGDDWLKYVGHRCAATGILHTWTKNLPAYHGATLQFIDFSGSTGE